MLPSSAVREDIRPRSPALTAHGVVGFAARSVAPRTIRSSRTPARGEVALGADGESSWGGRGGPADKRMGKAPALVGALRNEFAAGKDVRVLQVVIAGRRCESRS